MIRRVLRLFAFSTLGLACAATHPPGPPSCAADDRKPPPAPRCELAAEVVEYKRDTILTLWGYVGARPSRLPVVLELDSDARIESVCIEDGAALDRASRQQLERASRTLRAMRPGPRCLAGTRLELAEDFAAARARWRPRTPAIPRTDQLCARGQQRCTGWRDAVCALFSDGRRATYPDACEACLAAGVRGYDEGPCPIGP